MHRGSIGENDGKCLRPQSPGTRVPRPEQSSTEDLTLPAWNFASVVLHLSPPGKPSENVTKTTVFYGKMVITVGFRSGWAKIPHCFRKTSGIMTWLLNIGKKMPPSVAKKYRNIP